MSACSAWRPVLPAQSRASGFPWIERTSAAPQRFQSEDQPLELLEIDENAAKLQCNKIEALRRRRDGARVAAALDALKRAAEGPENTMPCLLDAVRAYATLGEICDALRLVFGSYQETTHI